MKTMLATLGFMAIVLSLPLSWWFVSRFRRDPQASLADDHRRTVDRLSAGTGFGMPAGGGDA